MTSGSAQEWSDTLARKGRLEIGLGRRRLVTLLVLSVVFVAMGVYIGLTSTATSDRVICALIVLFFGAGVVLFGRGLVRNTPAVVVDGFGITAAQFGVSIPWSSAIGTGVFSQRGTDLVQVEADQELIDAHYAHHRAQALARSANRRLMGGRESLSLPSPLEVDAHQFADWLGEEIRKRNPTPRQP